MILLFIIARALVYECTAVFFQYYQCRYLSQCKKTNIYVSNPFQIDQVIIPIQTELWERVLCKYLCSSIFFVPLFIAFEKIWRKKDSLIKRLAQAMKILWLKNYFFMVFSLICTFLHLFNISLHIIIIKVKLKNTNNTALT